MISEIKALRNLIGIGWRACAYMKVIFSACTFKILLKKKNRLNCLTVGEMKAKALVEDGHNSHGGVSNPRPPDVGAEPK